MSTVYESDHRTIRSAVVCPLRPTICSADHAAVVAALRVPLWTAGLYAHIETHRPAFNAALRAAFVAAVVGAQCVALHAAEFCTDGSSEQRAHYAALDAA